MKLERASGILLHPTSLPGGLLDEHAYRFVDWLAAAGQSWWQVLPLGPPDHTGSPYMSPSAFAGSPALLADRQAAVEPEEAEAFSERNAYWIDGWLRHGGLLDDQVRFEREWRALRAYAAERGVRIFGDIPIYVAQNGADHRAHPELFQPDGVAGVPPDAFSATGQLWGNPLYDWGAMRADGYRWWIERLRRMLDLVDLVRVDHFRGFVSYWAVPSGSTTAAGGRWRRGPGAELFRGADGRARPAAGRRRGSRRDHRAGRAPPPRVRPAGHGRAPVRARARPDEPAPPGEPPGAVGRLHRHARQPHDARVVALALATRSERWTGLDPGRSGVVADHRGVELTGRTGDRPAPGRPEPRQRSADEPPGHGVGQLAVALRRSGPDGRTSRAPEGADASHRPRS